MIRQDDALLRYIRQKSHCEWCGQPSHGELDPHHIIHRGLGGGSRLDVALNLIAVHRLPCHSEIENGGREAFEKCLRIVAWREGLPDAETVQMALYTLLRRPKESQWEEP